MKPAREVQTEFLRMEYTDPKKIIPDLYVRALGYDLFVEVAVTHFADSAKIQRLRVHKIPPSKSICPNLRVTRQGMPSTRRC
jgi:hypothetical protein